MEGLIRIPTAHGRLAVYDSGPPDGPVVVLIHGITASALSFAPLRRALSPTVRTLAVDLRGRGESADVPGPFGIETHVADLVGILDHLGIGQAVLVGHSMGAYVATLFARRHPDRTPHLVLVDGGFPIPAPDGMEPDAVIEAVVGPAITRLGMEFPSVEAYFDFWRAHPAVGPGWNADVEAYLRYDLVGTPPRLRSRVSVEAVRTDGRQLVTDPDLAGAIETVSVPMHLLRAGRGLLDEPGGLIPEAMADAAAARIPRLTVTHLPHLNHYTILLGPGAVTVAAAIDAALGRLGP